MQRRRIHYDYPGRYSERGPLRCCVRCRCIHIGPTRGHGYACF